LRHHHAAAHTYRGENHDPTGTLITAQALNGGLDRPARNKRTVPCEEIAFFENDVDGLKLGCPNLGKFVRATHEFAVYIASNVGSLINYGERFRAGERISSCLAESTVNAVISKPFAKRQQMQWTKRGAHLLLQTHTRALDGTLRPLFERWYPGLANDNGRGDNQAVAA